MEQENSSQEKRPDTKVRVSKDNKWLLIRVENIETPVFLSVNYIKAILENIVKREQTPVNIEKIKG